MKNIEAYILWVGTVDGYSTLDCEVVWHPAFMAPESGMFHLLVNGGEPCTLTCKSEVLCYT